MSISFKIVLLSFATILAVGVVLYIINRDKRKRIIKTPSIFEAFMDLANNEAERSIFAFSSLILNKDKSVLSENNPLYLVILAVLYRRSFNPEKSIKLFERLLTKESLNPTDASYVLCELVKSYKLSGKQKIYKKVVDYLEKKYSACPEILLLNSLYECQNKNYDIAIKKYLKYEKLTNESQRREISFCYYEMGLVDEVREKRIKLLKKALDMYKGNRPASFALLNLLKEDKKNLSAINLMKSMVNNNLLRNKEDLLIIENIFYDYNLVDDLYEYMIELVKVENLSPFPYLFLYRYYIKKSDNENALKIIKNCLEQKKSIVVLKEYIKAKNDNLLTSHIGFSNLYTCTACNSTQDQYYEICPVCATRDTLYFT